MEETKNYYTNSVNIVTSLYDVVLQFRTQAPIGTLEPGQTPAVEVVEQFNVRMSPQHAKALAAVLIKHVREYESQFKTKLVLPPDVEQLWAEAMGSGN